MILSTDLRLKNWVLYNGKAYQIDTISPELPILDADFGVGAVDYNNIYGIELTPEILEKCGFEKATDNYGGYLSPKFNIGRIRVKDNKWHNGVWDTEVNHLHQLQNLYWCLTNTELPIEL